MTCAYTSRGVIIISAGARVSIRALKEIEDAGFTVGVLACDLAITPRSGPEIPIASFPAIPTIKEIKAESAARKYGPVIKGRGGKERKW